MARKDRGEDQSGRDGTDVCNTILGVFRRITDEAIGDYDIRDPMRGVDPFDTREHNTYTEEEHNSLPPDLVPTFLSKMLVMHPQHYGFTFLGGPRGYVRRRCVRCVARGRTLTSNGKKPSC